MNEAIENYVPLGLAETYRKQARKIWSISLIVVFIWATAIIVAPIAKANGLDGFASALYSFFGNVCHQMPERSFQLHDHSFAVCTRCFGVYFGLFAGFLLYPLIRRVEEIEPLPRFWLFLAMVPIAIDWSLGIFGMWENTSLSRFITGTILGAACGVFIVPALVEIGRLLSMRRKEKRPSS